MNDLDAVRLAFDARTLRLLDLILGLVMYGVALDLRLAHFTALVRRPCPPLVGLVAQLALLPAATFVLTLVLVPGRPSLALGMLLVSACPGGNVSNFLTHLAGGRTSVSIGMTAVTTAACVVLLPLQLTFWGGLRDDTAALLSSVALDPLELLGTIAALLVLPTVLGMATAARLPRVATALRRPWRVGSILSFLAFVAVAFHANYDAFARFVGVVFAPVAIMNAFALALGWGTAWLAGLRVADRRAVTFEVGIQNSGLALVLVFAFFEGLGGMAVIAAWWGLWHLVTGFALAATWARDPRSGRNGG